MPRLYLWLTEYRLRSESGSMLDTRSGPPGMKCVVFVVQRLRRIYGSIHIGMFE
jgi:hypothetical protein